MINSDRRQTKIIVYSARINFRTMEKIILLCVLLFSNAIHLVESTCDRYDVKSDVGKKVCVMNDYDWSERCETKYPIVKLIISCSNLTTSNTVADISVVSDGSIPITIKVSDSDIAVLPTSIFTNMKKSTLTVLYLQNSNIQKIIPGAFNFLDNLKELYLDGNQLTTISDGLFNSLSLLEKLDLSRNKIQDISNHAFQGVKLIELHLTHNSISQMGQVLLDSFTSLKTLDISWNNLNNLTSFYNLPLTSLNLSHNTINVVDFEFFPDGLSKIDLSFNNLSEIINVNASRATEIILNHNNIGYLEKHVDAEVLDVSYNELEIVGSDMFDGNLKEINISHNLISSLNKDAFLGLHNLEYLLLNSNNLSVIPNSCFKDLHALTYLDLSRNELTHFTFSTFENLLNLKVLNISYNNLKDLQQYTLYSLGNLTDLLFQNNEISDIHVNDLKLHMPKLKTVNLDNNKWSCKKLLDILHSLKKVEVSLPNGNCWEQSNIHGIECYEDLNRRTALSEGSKPENDFANNSKMNKFFNEEFTNSTMYKYFNKDFKDSNFFRYLESLNNTNSNDQRLNASYLVKFIEELKLNYSDVYKERLEQSAMFNYFNDDFRKSNFFKYLESLKNQATIEDKFSGSKLEELILSFKETVENNSKLNNYHNSFREDFSKSSMYKYFNEDFKNSHFFKYLESLNERTVAQKHSENFNDSKKEKYVNSSEVGKTNDCSPNYTGLLLFISITLVVIICVMTISAHLLISRIKKYAKKEEVQLL